MKKISAKNLLLIKKLINVGCILLCLLMMAFSMFKYTSSSSLGSVRNTVTWDEGVSLFNFLFNNDLIVMDTTVAYLQEMFKYSYVVMWIALVFSVIALGISIYGIFSKKSLFSKIGSIVMMVVIVVIFTVSFDKESSANTVRYLSIFTPFYILTLCFGVIGLLSTITIKDK